MDATFAADAADGGTPRPLRAPLREPNELLERILHLDTLRYAWHRVRTNGGGPGRDGVKLGQFVRLLEYQLLTLAEEVRAGRYAPGTPRRVTIRAGRRRRPIVILPVRDRVLQRAALDVLTPLFEPTFHAHSYGYRPGRSLQHAVERIVRLRDRGHGWVVDADITACFPSLDHALLRAAIAEVVPEAGVRSLLSLWVGPEPEDGRRGRGIGQGSVIAPLLCNVYLDGLDDSLTRRRFHIVRYADDFVVLCRSREHAASALRATEKVLGGLRLTLHPAKSRVVSFDDGFDFLGVRFEGDDYSYVTNGKRVIVDRLPPPGFLYHPDADY